MGFIQPLSDVFDVIGKNAFHELESFLMKDPQIGKKLLSVLNVGGKKYTIFTLLKFGEKSQVEALAKCIKEAYTTSPVVIAAQCVPGPIGMTCSFIEAVLCLIVCDFIGMGLALLGCIPGVKQAKMLSKFGQALGKCEPIRKIFSSVQSLTKFWDKALKRCKKMKQLNIDETDLYEAFTPLWKHFETVGVAIRQNSEALISNSIDTGKKVMEKVVTYTPESLIEGTKAVNDYGRKFLQLTFSTKGLSI